MGDESEFSRRVRGVKRAVGFGARDVNLPNETGRIDPRLREGREGQQQRSNAAIEALQRAAKHVQQLDAAKAAAKRK